MIEHLQQTAHAPQRVVVIGAKGFVGSAVTKRLLAQGTPVLALSRAEVDLLAPEGADRLAELLEPTDSVVAAAAMAPVKNTTMLVDNMRLVQTLAAALSKAPVAHLVNISSDAVYADGPPPLTEGSPLAPSSLHGVMHLAREIALRTEVDLPQAHLRPTLIYGAQDPHNGYGPNRFRRLVAEGKDILLFGEGEERRDHVYIEDVAEVVARVLENKSVGSLNIATGEVHSFRDIAEQVVAIGGKAVSIQGQPRVGPMPHNGFRPFDVTLCQRAFPDFSYTLLGDGLRRSVS